MKLWFVMPPPSTSTRASSPGQMRATIASTSIARSSHVRPQLPGRLALSWFCIDLRHADRDHRLVRADRHGALRRPRGRRARRSSASSAANRRTRARRTGTSPPARSTRRRSRTSARSSTSPARTSGSAGATTTREQVLDSRVDGTRLIAETAARLPGRPVLLCASAIGFYGYARRRDRRRELAARHRLPRRASSRRGRPRPSPPAAAGLRTVHLRQGIVLSRHGGALAAAAAAVQARRRRPGRQRPPVVELGLARRRRRRLPFALEQPLEGPVNVDGARRGHEPGVRRRRSAARCTGRRSSRCRPFAVKAAFGQMGEEMLLGGQRVAPTKLEAAGFTFAPARHRRRASRARSPTEAARYARVRERGTRRHRRRRRDGRPRLRPRARRRRAASRSCSSAPHTIGGRVRTDAVDGFLLDHGFQVLPLAYPEARAAARLRPARARAVRARRDHPLGRPLPAPRRPAPRPGPQPARARRRASSACGTARPCSGSCAGAATRRPPPRRCAGPASRARRSRASSRRSCAASSSRSGSRRRAGSSTSSCARSRDGPAALPARRHGRDRGAARGGARHPHGHRRRDGRPARRLARVRASSCAPTPSSSRRPGSSTSPRTAGTASRASTTTRPRRRSRGRGSSLNGEGGPINNLCVPSEVAPSYAPRRPRARLASRSSAPASPTSTRSSASCAAGSGRAVARVAPPADLPDPAGAARLPGRRLRRAAGAARARASTPAATTASIPR